MLSTLDTGYCIQIRVQFTKMLHLDKWKSERRLILHIQFKQLISPCTDFRRIPTLKTSGCSHIPSEDYMFVQSILFCQQGTV